MILAQNDLFRFVRARIRYFFFLIESFSSYIILNADSFDDDSGWDEGVATMKEGETATFDITSDYAYGPRAMGNLVTTLFFLSIFERAQEQCTDAPMTTDPGKLGPDLRCVCCFFCSARLNVLLYRLSLLANV